MRCAERAPEVGAEVIQVTYNRLNRVAEERVLPAAAELELGVLARESLANGYLSGKYRRGSRISSPDDWRSSTIPRTSRRSSTRSRRSRRRTCQRVCRWHAGRWPGACSTPPSAPLIPGSKTVEQLESNVAAAELDLVSDPHPLTAPR
jgi:aryl-alcohol dehydrogenase-like predicted oxidoreductase